MTLDQIQKLLIDSPVKLEHALAAMDETDMGHVLANPKKRRQLFTLYTTLASECAAVIAEEAENLEFVWGPEEAEEG